MSSRTKSKLPSSRRSSPREETASQCHSRSFWSTRGNQMEVYSSLTALPAWRSLAAHVEQVRDVHLRSLFADDPSRGERFAADAAGLYLDYSKNRITDETM